jgi:two-component sensor histidine kinase
LLSYLDLHAGVGAVPANDQSIAEAMRSRIKTLARTHERMAFLEPGAKTALLPYLSEIVTLLVSATSFDIGVRAQGDEVLVDEKLLVPLSSIVSELVTNSIKHAFDGVPDPVVTIGVHDAGDRICIDYSDNGHKSPDPTNGSSGLGSMIVVALAAQLSATVERDRFAYRICIPAGNQESTA